MVSKTWLLAPVAALPALSSQLEQAGRAVRATALPEQGELAFEQVPQLQQWLATGCQSMVFVAPQPAQGGLQGEALINQTIDQLSLFVQASKLVVPRISAHGAGEIVLVCDIAGVSGRQGRCAEATSAGALMGAAKSMAKELGRYRINVNVIAHGPVAELGGGSLSSAEQKLFGLMRLGQPTRLEHLGHSILHLLRGEHWMTGQVLHVDNGLII